MAIYPRISGRLGNQIDLNATFIINGVPADPFAVRRISIYKTAVTEENLVAQIPIPTPCETSYPSPLVREYTGSSMSPGIFHLYWDVPSSDIDVPNIFFDVWEYMTTETTSSGTDPCDPSIIDNEELWQRQCNEFWLYPDGTYIDSGLETIRLGFEAMDSKFNQPEKRTLEVGIMPMPLYDFDYNLVAPIIPFLVAKFTLFTENCEVLIDGESMRIGLRQGTYRSNPFVLQYLFDTTRVLKGAYRYRVDLTLPNGETRSSPDLHLQVN